MHTNKTLLFNLMPKSQIIRLNSGLKNTLGGQL